MDSNNLIQIIINLAQSLGSVQRLVSGFAYLAGLCFFITGIMKLRKLSQSHSGESAFVPMAYLVGGAILVYLPSGFHVLTYTVFGTGSALQYASVNPITSDAAIMLIIQTAGLIWFIRGCVMLVTASQPGTQQGPKGAVYLFAGILSMNIQTTTAIINGLLNQFMQFSLAVKNAFGY